ncbi:MAG: hypothetical protein EXS31_12970 [Pedosphaera sp.]|nr:hypothetical protein [Pedosphaera sp.]
MKSLSVLWLACALAWRLAGTAAIGAPLDPLGKIHIPIGVANTLDTLKTFVEAEGNFSPGFGSYGVYFWVWDGAQKKLFAPTMDGVKCEHGLGPGGALIPWSQWSAGEVEVRTEVCQIQRQVTTNTFYVVGARARLTNRGDRAAKVSLYVAARPLGPAGGAVKSIGFSKADDALAINGYPAIIATEPAQAVGAVTNDFIGDWAMRGELPAERYPSSKPGDCSGAMRFDLELTPGQAKTLGFTCSVLPLRRAVGHRWDGVSAWAQFDLNTPAPANGGVLQFYPGLSYYRKLKPDTIFAEAAAYWKGLAGRVSLQLPDPRWAESFAAIVGHSALCLDDGAPDVAVVNYNVFNRDGVYLANILQKSGNDELAQTAIDYFLGHPFNGRVQPEADNPGQVLWIMGEHWRFTRDRTWLERVYPSVRKMAAMIRYYRTTAGPHYVSDTSLEFGDALPQDQRKELKPGACDGHHPEYTEAYDIAGLRGAMTLAEALGQADDHATWRKLADDLAAVYDQKFGADPGKGYGSYSVLWPCRLYPFNEGKAFDQFKEVSAQKPASWRYFPLAKSHQGLLAGNRAAGFETLAIHLAHPQMQGWYAFDEGGDSGVGGWNHVRTTWRHGQTSDAMPHGWAIAEFFLLLRDSLAFEDGGRLLLFAGVPPEWFNHPSGMKIENLPTHFSKCSLAWTRTGTGATFTLAGEAAPPEGFMLCLPGAMAPTVSVGGKIVAGVRGRFPLPAGTRRAEIVWKQR